MTMNPYALDVVSDQCSEYYGAFVDGHCVAFIKGSIEAVAELYTFIQKKYPDRDAFYMPLSQDYDNGITEIANLPERDHGRIC